MRQLVKEKENSEFKPVKLRLKIDLVSYPARAEGLVNMIYTWSAAGNSLQWMGALSRQSATDHSVFLVDVLLADSRCSQKDIGSDGPEKLKILKKRQLGVDFGLCRQTVGLFAIEADSWSWGPTIMM